jgi:uncharacterized protein YecT (DUF1311 family)
MKDECYGVNTGSDAKRNPYCDVNTVLHGAYHELNSEYDRARKEMSPDKFEVLQADEKAWFNVDAPASKYDEIDVVNERTKLVRDWANAPKDVDGGDAVTPAERLQQQVKDVEAKANACTGDSYDCIKQEQAGWESIVNQAYAKLQEEGSLGVKNGANWHYPDRLRAEHEAWQNFRDQNAKLVDDQFGIDETKSGQTERDIFSSTHNVAPAADKNQIIKDRAKQLVDRYSTLTGPGD